MWTNDKFICGLCLLQFNDIHKYVNHMIEIEKCSAVFENSKSLGHITLPR